MNHEMGKTSKLLAKASFAGTAASTMVSPIYYLLAAKFGGGVLDAGLGYGILSITTGAVVYVLGRSAWFETNARVMVFVGFITSGLGELSYLVIHSTEQFFAAQILMGIGLGVLNPAWDALYSDKEDGMSPVRKWCVWTSGVEIADGLAALLGAALLKVWGFNALFCAMAALNTVAVFLSFRIMKPILPEQGGIDVQAKIKLG
jgi:hypothetical protein